MTVTSSEQAMRERVAAMTTDGDHHNRWPDACEVVDIVKMSYDSASEEWRLKQAGYVSQYELGRLEGQAVFERNLWDSVNGCMPPDIARDLELDGFRGGKLISARVYFTWAPAQGQIDHCDKRNVLAVFPRKGYVVLGCSHEYEAKRGGRCYTICDCKRCGHHFEVDSSD